jgi:DNA repair exonuclease SbcCD ATPase subunit
MPQVTQVPAPVTGSPAQIYQGQLHARSELREQLDRVQGERNDLQEQYQQASSDADKKGLDARIQTMDQRITALDKAIADADAAVAKAAAVPGAYTEPPREAPTGPPDEAYVLGGIFMIVIAFPIALAFARRIWKKSVQTVIQIPQELYDRFSRLDQAIDSMAIEVERIGENQRFLTKMQTEQKALAAGPAQRVERAEVPERSKIRE